MNRPTLITMGFKIQDPTIQPKRPRASIHKSGKIGFNSDAHEFMELTPDSRFLVAMDEDDPTDSDIILIPASSDHEKAIKPSKGGDYLYLHLRPLLDRMGFDYENYKYRYDIEEDEFEGRTAYRLVLRDEIKERT